MNPDYMLPELLEQIPKWTMIEDCYHGQDAIAKKGEIYLPNPSPINEDEAVKVQRYIDYQKRAVFYNVTKRTANAMAGIFDDAVKGAWGAFGGLSACQTWSVSANQKGCQRR
ncbi:62kDa structural protein [Moraxella catarrhalis]|uniref:hypothetical protein n=1 Tax=Moraxella catarrhalis TaxID=480 RepID=UPI0007E461CD|nr:hypothetical protein [Moraxella catarrhalis]OAV21447.1 62kDa structural protein [Moraxella catarrhalis]